MFWGLMYVGIWLKLSKRSSNFRDKLRTQTLCIYILLIAWSQKRRKKFISIKGILNHTDFEHCEQATGQEDFKRPISKKNGQVTFTILRSLVKTNISNFKYFGDHEWKQIFHRKLICCILASGSLLLGLGLLISPFLHCPSDGFCNDIFYFW